MSLPRTKSLDALYENIRDYDLVLVPDAPLASALNRRLDRPHLGRFASTPRRLAAGRRERAEDRVAFLEVIDETDLTWKETAYAVGNILQCWEHQGSPDAILDYDTYVDDATRTVLDVMRELASTSRRVTDYEFDGTQNVAVVGLDQLTPLERGMLPDDYDEISLFRENTVDLPPFHIFESSTTIVDALLDTVTPDNADRVAVVLDGGSRYSSLVESAFEAADIPFYGGPGFVDDPDYRAFLGLLRAGFRGSGTTVGDIRPLLSRLDVTVDIEHDQKRLDAVDVPELSWLTALIEAIDTLTFGDVLGTVERQTGRTLDDFREELTTLGLTDVRVTSETVDDLVFYLQSYDVPVDNDNEGVLLADAKSSGYVDRPVVFYLGLDDGWTHSAPQRPWVDTDAQFDRYIRQFQTLLQSGDEQYFLVQDTEGGHPVTPCLYFEAVLDEDFERFSDLGAVHHDRPRAQSGEGFGREPRDVSPGRVDAISQSSLNSYANCPRDYLFSQLVDDPDRDYFREGNLFHDFAEFYVNHPDAIDEAAIDEAVDGMVEAVHPFFADWDKPLRRRKYRIGLETIVGYLDANPPEDVAFLTPNSGWGSNFFAEYFDQPLDSSQTERWFENDALGIKGKIDLVHAADRLLDYKSSSKKSPYKVVKRARIDPPADTPNFQALLYLCHYRTVRPNEPLEFTFFHFLETLDDVVTGDVGLDETLTTVSYYPWTFDEYVGSHDAFEVLLDGYSDCQETFGDLGYVAYSDIMDERTFPETTGREELRASEFAESFTAAVDVATSDSVDAEKGCDQAIRALDGVRKRNFFREDVDAFETFVEEQLAQLNARRAGDERFPVEGPGGEPNYRRVEHRDLLLEGDR